jgi:hypothetical protein
MCVCVCLSQVKGQKNNKGQSHLFAIQLSSNQVSRGCEFSQSAFKGLKVRPIRFRGDGNSAYQVWRGWKFDQSGFVGLEIRPIRFCGAGNSANQVLKGWSFNQSDHFSVLSSSNQVWRGWEFSQSHDFGVSLSSNQFFRAQSSVNQVFLKPEDHVIRGKDRTL